MKNNVLLVKKSSAYVVIHISEEEKIYLEIQSESKNYFLEEEILLADTKPTDEEQIINKSEEQNKNKLDI